MKQLIDNPFIQYLLLIFGALIVAFITSYILKKILGLIIKKYSEKLKTDPTNFSFLKNSVSFIIYTSAIIFIFYKIPYLHAVGTALFAGAGVIAVVVGFASQKAFSNIISGIFILIFKPFKISDIIEFNNGQKGIVEDITLRHTLIKDYENRRIVIPNSIISEETITNCNIQDEKIRKHLIFSISYDSNIDTAIEIIQKLASKHPLLVDQRTEEELQKNEPIVKVRVIALSDFSVDLKAYVWANNNDEGFAIKCDLLKSVKEEFDKQHIEIPFPYRTIVYKNDIKNEEEKIK